MIEGAVILAVGIALGYGLSRLRSSAAPRSPPAAGPAQGGSPTGAESIPSDVSVIAQMLASDELNRLADPRDLLQSARFEAGAALLADESMPLERVVDYALGSNWVVGIMAAEALARREDSEPAVPRILSNIGQAGGWPLFFRLRFLEARAPGPTLGALLASVDEWWEKDPPTVSFVDAYAAHRVEAGEPLTLLASLNEIPTDRVERIETFVRRLAPERAGPLLDEIGRFRALSFDLAFLRSAGRFWLRPRGGAPLLPTPAVHAHLREMRAALAEDPPRSILLVGEPGVGKSAICRAFTEQLLAGAWHVLETSGAELMAGTRFLGEIETRVDRLRREASSAKRVALLVEALNEMHTAGRTIERPVGILDHLWPHLQSRELFMVAEVSSDAYPALERAFPTLPVAVKVIRVAPADEATTRDLGQRLVTAARRRAGEAAPDLVSEALRLARVYLAHRALPGSVLGLLELALARSRAGRRAVPAGREHLLAALGEVTGLPADVLDERQHLDVQALRSRFLERVIGQDEAVDCLVERVAMLKAGLTDARRPIGVFLFAGPTGTGKTEIAKTLAEILFGSAEQMIRLDMSEFQTPDSLARLLGTWEGDRGPPAVSLAQRIRQKPFAVILLDEFEKAHEAVWDVFLQVFDDGRLTDRQGNLADFRHAIIILTSNLGATLHAGAEVGFLGEGRQFSAHEVMREVNRAFRKELINRLDRIVVFRPLDRDSMRRILHKELDLALERRGLHTKAWAVEWEPSAVEFLLGKGFTHDLGARPLRRAIERWVLAPLSMTIVERKAPEGEQFLFVREEGGRLSVTFVDPDADAGLPQRAPVRGEEGPSVAGLVARCAGGEEEASFLVARVDRLLERVEGEAWRARKAQELSAINRDGFWEREDRFDVLERAEHMDRLEEAAATLDALADRLERSPAAAALVRRVAEKLYVLEAGMDDLDLGRPGQAFLGVRLIPDDAAHPQAPGFLARIQDMYRGWAGRRRMAWTEVARGGSDPSGEAVYAVAGFGSWAILARESGLHVLECPREEGRFDRVRVRVAVAANRLPPNLPAGELLHAARSALGAPDCRPSLVVRRYREAPSPLVRDNVAGWRSGRLEAVWAGDFDVLGG